jgi:hypothetical protein
MKKLSRVIIASLAGILSCLFPIVGVYMVYLVFPKSLCTDFRITYALLVNSLNFAVIFTMIYCFLSLITQPKDTALPG